MSSIQRRVSRKVDKAIFGYRLIEPGDRVLVAISGGKDSVTLAHQLGLRSRGYVIPFTVAAVHIRTEYADLEGVERLRELAAGIGLPFEQIEVSVTGRLKPGRRMNCYWCATQRRTELLRYAQANGFNRIALGHHMDDILETFLMNMMQKGELSTMLPALRYDRYPQWIIRPLAWVTERETEQYVAEIGYEAVRCRCGFDATSRRREVRRLLDLAVATGGEQARENMMKALHNIQLRYMPSFVPRSDGEGGPERPPEATSS